MFGVPIRLGAGITIAGDYVIRLLNLSRFPEETVVEIPFTLGE